MARLLATSIAENAGTIIVTCLILLGALFGLGLGLWLYRRWRSTLDRPAPTPWTFEDLRKLRDQGQLNEEEYQTLRAGMISAFKDRPAAGERSEPVASPQEHWDWVADEGAHPEGFDVKKESPG